SVVAIKRSLLQSHSPTSSTVMVTQGSAPTTFDELFKRAKKYGRYQIFFFILMQYLSISQGAIVVGGFFSLGGLAPNYICNDEDLRLNYSSKVVKKDPTMVCEQISKCKNLSTANVWYSMYEEFEFVCIKDHIFSTIASTMPIISLCGNLIAGHLADHFGRKWLMIAGTILETACGLAQSFAPTWGFYVFFVVIHCFIGPLFNATAISLMLESVYSEYRLIQAYAFQWSFGYIFAGILAYMVGNWRLYLAIANAMVVPVIPLMLLLEESPRFFAQRKKIDQAVRAMNRVAKFNKSSERFTEADIVATQGEFEKRRDTNKYSILDLFRSVQLAKYSLSQIITGIGVNIISTILLYNAHDLSGNPLLNISLMGALRVWTPFVAIFLEHSAKTFGRKEFLVVTQGVVSICFIIMFSLDIVGKFNEFHSLATAAALIGYGVESGFVWMIYKLYTTELFPTVIRSIALSTFSITSLIGSVLSPQLVYLAKFWHPSPYFGAALITFLATILAVVLLPETKGRPLPDSLLDAKSNSAKCTSEISLKSEYDMKETMLKRKTGAVQL
uniref:Major facilitator superfamily (MFS) profile domain-containing protein n=1 Tax=Parascaris univalens TaxID=6257 RepID=A0A915AC84_PARUN